MRNLAILAGALALSVPLLWLLYIYLSTIFGGAY